MNKEKLPSIPEFFKGRDIFITGGSGFMGKVLIEKLLRSCPDINRIFILIRDSKNVAAKDRIEGIQKLPLFELLHKEQPENFDKMIPINGDITVLNLGISKDDLKLMENVSVIFHAAASVKFDDPLHEAIIINTRGTREVMLFAEKLKNLKALVHVSTTYSNPDKKIVIEEVYPPNGNWQAAIKIAETYPDLLTTLQQKYTNYEPNTYTFTKGLAEQVANSFKNRLPIIIYRPSIVISILDEPLIGWIDNFNGPIGLLLASSIGILRTAYGDPDIISDFTPVDTSIKAMLIAAWKRGTRSTSDQIPVYNCSTSLQRSITTGYIVKMGEELSSIVPMDKMLWTPGGSITKCKYKNLIKFIFLQLLTAYVVDCFFKIMGKKPFLAKLQRKIFAANMALQYFIRTHWEFKNDQFMSLNKELKECDKKSFSFDSFVTADIRNYFIDGMLGIRRYLLHEKDEALPAARAYYKRMFIIDKVIRITLYVILLYIVYKYVFLIWTSY